MIITKPKLSLEGQIEHLKKKGVLFNIMNEESAKEYLTQHNNYFKLTAYRKNYDKHPDGENKGKYINPRVCISGGFGCDRYETAISDCAYGSRY